MDQSNVNHELLHGVSLSDIMDFLIEKVGFEKLDEMVRINCFANNPSKQSSLKFLRKTEWARLQVQWIYVKYKRKEERKENKKKEKEEKKKEIENPEVEETKEETQI